MLDGRVLEASQVEYKPFGKPPLQRELSVNELGGAMRHPAHLTRKTPAVRRHTPMHSRTRRPDCPENYGSALLYSRTLTENSVSVLLCSSALTDSPPGFPASNLGSKNKAMGKIKLFPTRGLRSRVRARASAPA